MNELRLKKNADRRIRRGHVWVYSNEVDIDRTPLKQFEPGEQVVVTTASGRVLGSAFVNPAALISARLISRSGSRRMDLALLRERLTRALALRQKFFAQPYYRLAFGDSDGLPGLVVDRFGDVCVVQIAIAGMDHLRTEVVQALVDILNPTTIILKNDTTMRAAEGLEVYVETAHGPAQETATLQENDVAFTVPLLHGQKTGWFYDHRMNRARLPQYVRDKRVLDLFCYVGGWGIQAAVHGARSVTFVDSSEFALNCLADNARLNSVEPRTRRLQGDAFAITRELRENAEQFDLIIIDPPAFIPRRKDVQAGEAAYQRIHQAALGLLAGDGMLISSSCSMHLGRDRFLDLIQGCGHHAGRFMQLLEQGHQAPDHPILPAVPETDYLKAMFIGMIPAL